MSVDSTPGTLPVDGLIGRWFHSWRPARDDDSEYVTRRGERVLEWQGQVVGRDGDVFIAQLYSWWDGCASNEVIATIEDMRGWTFYRSSEEMQVALGCRESFKGQLCGNPCTHVIRDGWMGHPIYACWKCIKSYAGTVEEIA